MSKMDDLTLLAFLQGEENAASAYANGTLDGQRVRSLNDYNRVPYGTEEEGLSQFVASDVFDAVETVLPDLLEIFCGSDQAVTFDPVGAEDEEGAEQATDGVNHVFYKQNAGFMVAYTAIKDALMLKNCAVMARKVDEDQVATQPYGPMSVEQLQMLIQTLEAQDDVKKVEITGQEEFIQPDEMGEQQLMVSVELRTTKRIKKILVEAFPPEQLLVYRDHNSPLLADCRYVCRLVPVTLSEVREMFPKAKVGPEDMAQYGETDVMQLKAARDDDQDTFGGHETSDESLTEGFLRYEFVLLDHDGDGIAERRMIVRLADKVLLNQPYTHVPIFTASPYLRTHRWAGQSIADHVEDIQRLHTDMIRGMVNSLMLANNPRTIVGTTADWTSLVNMDDLLDSRAGGVIRSKDINAIREQVTTWVGQQAIPMLEVVEAMKENRLGITRYNSGLDADSLNHTARGAQIQLNQSQRKIKLIARIFAECLFAPMFKSILKLLTEGDMQKLSMRLNGRFVEYDPNEWSDGYDMSINVGLGTGDKTEQSQQLMMLMQDQMMLMQSGSGLVDEKNVFKTRRRLVETMGYKQVGEFYTDPESPEVVQAKQNQPPPPPPPEIQREQMRIQADQQKFQQQQQNEQQKFQAENQLDEQRAQREAQQDAQKFQAQQQADMERAEIDSRVAIQKAQIEAEARIEVERIRQQAETERRRYEAEARFHENRFQQLENLDDSASEIDGTL